jgi:hypothetical protein
MKGRVTPVACGTLLRILAPDRGFHVIQKNRRPQRPRIGEAATISSSGSR